MNVIALDDEPLALRQLVAYISRVPEMHLVAACQSAAEACGVLAHESVDAIFCDIRMPDLNGLDFVRSLAEPPFVVFTTAYSEYALEGYSVEAVDYLLKPFDFDEFQRASQRLQERISQRNAAQTFAAQQNDACICVRSDRKDITIPLSSIRYVQAMSEYVRIFVDGDKRSVTTLLPIKRMEEMLPPQSFMRVHRSYIVSLSRIREFERNNIVLDDHTELPVGDSYRAALNTFINSLRHAKVSDCSSNVSANESRNV